MWECRYSVVDIYKKWGPHRLGSNIRYIYTWTCDNIRNKLHTCSSSSLVELAQWNMENITGIFYCRTTWFLLLIACSILIESATKYSKPTKREREILSIIHSKLKFLMSSSISTLGYLCVVGVASMLPSVRPMWSWVPSLWEMCKYSTTLIEESIYLHLTLHPSPFLFPWKNPLRLLLPLKPLRIQPLLFAALLLHLHLLPPLASPQWPCRILSTRK